MKYKLGKSTLQRGIQSHELTGWLLDWEKPDLELRSLNFRFNSIESPFLPFNQNGGSENTFSAGGAIGFNVEAIDKFGVMTIDQVFGTYSIPMTSLFGKFPDGTPFDFRSSVYRVSAAIQTEENSIGSRTLSICGTLYDLGNSALYLKPLFTVPLVASPDGGSYFGAEIQRFRLNLFELKREYIAWAQARKAEAEANGTPFYWEEALVNPDYSLTLNLYQTSAGTLQYEFSHLWVKWLGDIDDPEAYRG